MITDADDLVVAYASVAMTGIDRSAAPETLAKGALDPVPALLPGRLAVDHRYSNLGIGTALAAHALATAVELNEKAACRAVVATALNPKARTWWQRLSFHPFDPADRDQLDLYLLTAGIETTLRNARSHIHGDRPVPLLSARSTSFASDLGVRVSSVKQDCRRLGLCCGRESEEYHERSVQLHEFVVAEAAESLAQP